MRLRPLLANVDLAEPFAAAGLEALCALPRDPVHPNAVGHALAARIVAERIAGAK